MSSEDVNPDDRVVQLCIKGMEAEMEGQLAEARRLFVMAWDLSLNDFDACVAAHYLARHQPTPEDCLHWNREAVTRARLVGDERVASFFPSLYLNLGHSHEVLGDSDAASSYYELAARHLDAVEDGRYGDVVRHGIREGKQRMSEHMRE